MELVKKHQAQVTTHEMTIPIHTSSTMKYQMGVSPSKRTSPIRTSPEEDKDQKKDKDKSNNHT